MARSRKPEKDKLTRELLSGIDEMQDLAPGTQVHVYGPDENTRSLATWKMVAEFSMPGGMLYDDVVEYLINWRDDKTIRKKIGRNRLAKIIVRYKNKKGRGSRGEATLCKIGGWDIAISIAVERLVVRDGNRVGLIERYGKSSKIPSYIEEIIVWFAANSSEDVKIGREKKQAKAKASKGKRRVRH